jgi:hypothetical protein
MDLRLALGCLAQAVTMTLRDRLDTDDAALERSGGTKLGHSRTLAEPDAGAARSSVGSRTW